MYKSLTFILCSICTTSSFNLVINNLKFEDFLQKRYKKLNFATYCCPTSISNAGVSSKWICRCTVAENQCPGGTMSALSQNNIISYDKSHWPTCSTVVLSFKCEWVLKQLNFTISSSVKAKHFYVYLLRMHWPWPTSKLLKSSIDMFHYYKYTEM